MTGDTALAARLHRIAGLFRDAIERCRDARRLNEPSLLRFPHGSCGTTSELLGRYFEETAGFEALYVSGQLPGDRAGSHAWLTFAGYVIDITADQFGEAPVIVSDCSIWHCRITVEDPPRLVITPTRGNWPHYPVSDWETIVRQLRSRAR